MYINSLGQRINTFDNSDGTLKTFNEIFYLSPISGFVDNASVEIGDPVTSMTRVVIVNGIEIMHDFRPLNSEVVTEELF